MTFTIPLWVAITLKIFWFIAKVLIVFLAIVGGWFLWKLRNFRINF